ncbi:MAG TPA: ATP-binding protein [Puia sp.]|nr:ATP-binding protein [Puia sp.]
MTAFNNISIRNKLVLMQVFTSALVLGIFATFYIITEIQNYKNRKAKDVQSIAAVVAQNSASSLQFQDNQAAQATLAELHAVSPDVVYSAILDQDHHVFASVGRAGSDTALFREYRNSVGAFFSAGTLIVVRTISNNTDKIGSIYLQVRLNELARMRSYLFRLAMVLSGIAVLAAFLISFVLQTYISSRLLALVRTMRRVGDTGDYTLTLADEGTDEISVLISVFNSLLLQIRENERRKDEFIGVASHELKTPLTNVKGYLEILRSMEERNPQRQLVDRAFLNAGKLEKLIEDLLDVTKIQTGQMQLNLTEFDFDELVSETIASAQMLSKDRPIVFEAKAARQVRADRQRIEQVLANLLSNAVKYSTDGKPIVVTAVATGGDIIVEVADQGEGVPAGEENAIFGRFYRAKGVSQHISGFGLGLYICRDIIQRHRGRIWVRNREDGASFLFQLPIAGPDFKQQHSSTKSSM